MPNLRLYNEAIMGHARTIPRCSLCLQEDYSAAVCPRTLAWNEAVWQALLVVGARHPRYMPMMMTGAVSQTAGTSLLCQDAHSATACSCRHPSLASGHRSCSPFCRMFLIRLLLCTQFRSLYATYLCCMVS